MGCVIAALVFLIIVEIIVYYVSWILVTTYTDFGTLVSVLLTIVLGGIIGSLMFGGANRLRS